MTIDYRNRTLVASSGNPVLVRHWNLLLVPTRILVVIRSGIIDISEPAKEHRPILEALERGDATLAGQRVYEHINRIAERLQQAAEGGWRVATSLTGAGTTS